MTSLEPKLQNQLKHCTLTFLNYSIYLYYIAPIYLYYTCSLSSSFFIIHFTRYVSKIRNPSVTHQHTTATTHEDQYRFVSQTLRQAAYEQMLYEHRRTIHYTVGDILKLHNSDRKDPRVLRLTAHHYYKARDAARAVPMLVAAGEDAIARGNSTVAYKCFDRLLRISGNMYVDPVANSVVVRKPWSDQDRENQNQKKEDKEDKKEKDEIKKKNKKNLLTSPSPLTGFTPVLHLTRLQRAQWGRKLGGVIEEMGNAIDGGLKSERHYWLSLSAFGITQKKSIKIKLYGVSKAKERHANGSTVVSISMTTFFFKPLLLPLSRVSLSKTPQTSLF